MRGLASCAALGIASPAVSLGIPVDSGEIQYTVYDIPEKPNAIVASLVTACVADLAPKAFWNYRHTVFIHQAAWQPAYPADDALLRLAATEAIDTWPNIVHVIDSISTASSY